MNKEVVCHISTVHPISDPRIFYRECKSLLKGGYEVHLVIQHDKEEILEGIHIHPLAKPGNRIKRIFATTIVAFFKAIKTKAKIYHLHDPELFVVGKMLWLMRKKVIFDIHENVSEQIKVKDWLPLRNFVSSLYFMVDYFAAKFFYLILAEFSYEEKYSGISSNYRIILNTPDISFFNNYYTQNRKPSNQIFYIGVIGENRCIFEILKAIHILKETIPDIFFHCIGPVSNHSYQKIRELAYFDEVKDQVKFYGRLNLEEGYEISERCSVGLALLKPVGNYVGSYPTKIFEYMSIGMPFVTSDFRLYKDIVEREKCGICVNPDRPEEIANAISQILTNPEQLQQMGENGRQAAISKYHWGIEEKKLLDFYERILDNTQ